jgi:hypothetical protein
MSVASRPIDTGSHSRWLQRGRFGFFQRLLHFLFGRRLTTMGGKREIDGTRVTRGRCYDHNFLRFSTIFGEKNVMIKILHNLALFWVKNANFSPKICLKSLHRSQIERIFVNWAIACCEHFFKKNYKLDIILGNYFPAGKVVHWFWQKNGLGYILGDLIANSSGHPGRGRDYELHFISNQCTAKMFVTISDKVRELSDTKVNIYPYLKYRYLTLCKFYP